MAPNETVNGIRSEMGEQGGEHLGDLCWWELSEARVSRATLESMWTGAGLDVAHLPEAPTDQRALRQAVDGLHLRGTNILVRQSLKSAAEIAYAVVEESNKGDGTNGYRHLSTVRLDRATGSCGADSPHSIAAEIVTQYHALRDTHSADEVRVAIVRCVRDGCCGAALRRSGGFYWVPAVHAPMLRALQSVVERIGASSFYPFPLHRSPEAVRAVSASAQDALRSELRGIHDEIAKYVTDRPTRDSTYAHRFEELAALRDRAALYSTVLSVEVTDLEGEIANLEGVLQSILDGGTPNVDAAPVATVTPAPEPVSEPEAD